jgi:AcrR family transcriptional regulator
MSRAKGKVEEEQPAAPAWVRPSKDGILESAERVFARNGYGETSLRQLMAEAGVSTTAFYARFPSKEAVLVALVQRLLGTLAEEAAVALGEAKSTEEGFAIGVEVLVRSLRPHKIVTKLALTEAVASKEARDALRDAYGTLAGLLAAMIGKAAHKGGAEVDDPEAVAWALVGTLKIQLERWAVFDDLSDAQFGKACKAAADAMLPLMRLKKKR